MKKNLILISTVAVVIAIFVFGMFTYQKKTGEVRADAAAKNTASLVQFHSPSTGASDAKVTIVEFFDPSCEACRAFYPLVKSILAENPGKVRLVLRYAAFHKDSDIVVKLLEASKAQGLYWQVLEEVMRTQPEWADHGNPQVQRLWEILKPVGLDIERAKRDMESPGIVAVLKQDTSDVMTLQVQKTPTFYVNGKPLVDMSEKGLRYLVREEVKAAYL